MSNVQVQCQIRFRKPPGHETPCPHGGGILDQSLTGRNGFVRARHGGWLTARGLPCPQSERTRQPVAFTPIVEGTDSGD